MKGCELLLGFNQDVYGFGPADGSPSFRSRVSEPWSLTKGEKISSLHCCRASLGEQGDSNPCLQNHSLVFLLNYVYRWSNLRLIVA